MNEKVKKALKVGGIAGAGIGAGIGGSAAYANKDAIKDSAAQAGRTIKDTASRAGESIKDTASNVRDSASRAGDSIGKKFRSTFNRPNAEDKMDAHDKMRLKNETMRTLHKMNNKSTGDKSIGEKFGEHVDNLKDKASKFGEHVNDLKDKKAAADEQLANLKDSASKAGKTIYKKLTEGGSIIEGSLSVLQSYNKQKRSENSE